MVTVSSPAWIGVALASTLIGSELGGLSIGDGGDPRHAMFL